MPKIAIIYFSQTDITAQLANAIATGAKQEPNIDVFSYRVRGEDIVAGRFVNHSLFTIVEQCDALVFGSPTYMGGVAAQFKAFADASSEAWCEQKWANKIAAGFTSGGALNGDQSCTLQYLNTLANQHGMIWLGLDKTTESDELKLNRLGTQLGIASQGIDGQLHPADSATGEYLGKRVARLAIQLHR